MADTIHTYLPEQKCEECKENVVTIIHLINDNDVKHLCSDCFKKLYVKN